VSQDGRTLAEVSDLKDGKGWTASYDVLLAKFAQLPCMGNILLPRTRRFDEREAKQRAGVQMKEEYF
jgi:hypothetical protein